MNRRHCPEAEDPITIYDTVLSYCLALNHEMARDAKLRSAAKRRATTRTVTMLHCAMLHRALLHYTAQRHLTQDCSLATSVMRLTPQPPTMDPLTSALAKSDILIAAKKTSGLEATANALLRTMADWSNAADPMIQNMLKASLLMRTPNGPYGYHGTTTVFMLMITARGYKDQCAGVSTKLEQEIARVALPNENPGLRNAKITRLIMTNNEMQKYCSHCALIESVAENIWIARAKKNSEDETDTYDGLLGDQIAFQG